MHTTRIIIALLIAASLSACGGGGGGGSPQPTPETNTQKPPVIIAMFGDSTMRGYTTPGGPGNPEILTPYNAPYYLGQDLTQAGMNVLVNNYAENGTEIADLFAGLYGYPMPWSQLAPTLGAKIVVSNYGINDSRRGDETPEQFGQYLSQWVDSARAAGMTPVLEEPNPVCDSVTTALPAYVAQTVAVATQKRVPLIQQYAYIKSLPNWESMLSDCIHPTPALYEIKGKREADQIQALIKQMGLQ